jgi:hypothetical protein
MADVSFCDRQHLISNPVASELYAQQGGFMNIVSYGQF